MNPNSFIFLSEIIGHRCIDGKTGEYLGRVADLAAHFREAYPRVSGLVVHRGFGSRKLIRWDSVRSFELRDKKLLLTLTDRAFDSPDSISDDEVLVCDVFYDKQIISVSGAKVVRVNDLHLLGDGAKMWIVHFDVGVRGLLRRLGFERGVSWFLSFFFSYTLKDSFIRWKDSQLAMEANEFGEYELRIPVNRLSEMHPADLADILAELGTDDRTMIFNSLDAATAAGTLQEVSKNLRVQIAENLEPDRLARIVDAMERDEAADLVEHLKKETKAALFGVLPGETAAELVELMNYSGKSAGSIMNTGFASVSADATVGAIFDEIRREFSGIESLHYVYAVDSGNVLCGVVSLKDLICADSALPVSAVMKKNIIRCEVDTPLDEVARIFLKYNFPVIPVVDEQSRIEGTITIKDALEAVYPRMAKEAE